MPVIVFAVLLLLSAGVAGIIYVAQIFGLLIPGGILVCRQAISKFLWYFVVRPFMPDHLRHEYHDMVHKVNQLVGKEVAALIWLWHYEPRWVKALIAACGALSSGAIAGVFILSPGSISHVPLIGHWLSDTVAPYFMRSAAFRIADEHVPKAWKRIPVHIRDRVHKPFKRLWWKTARHGVRTRQLVGRMAKARRQQFT